MLVLEHFSAWIFWQNGWFSTATHFGTGAKMSVSKHPYCFVWCWNFPVLECPRAKISQCCKVPVPKSPCAEKYSYRNVHWDRMSMCQNILEAKKFLWWNVRAEMYLPKRCLNKPKPLEPCITVYTISVFTILTTYICLKLLGSRCDPFFLIDGLSINVYMYTICF